jgi:hypothetical protein
VKSTTTITPTETPENQLSNSPARVSFELDELDFKAFARISVLREDQAY